MIVQLVVVTMALINFECCTNINTLSEISTVSNPVFIQGETLELYIKLTVHAAKQPPNAILQTGSF